VPEQVLQGLVQPTQLPTRVISDEKNPDLQKQFGVSLLDPTHPPQFPMKELQVVQ
jgi:hypothetical protein